MDILMKYAKKKTVFILSTVLSGIVTLLYLISKFGPTTSSNVNINDINELAGTIGSMVTIIQIIFYLFIILAIVTAILSGVYFFKKNKQEYVMLGEFIVSCINSINSLWFAKGEDDDNDSVIAIYKIDETYTSSFSGQQDVETYYAAIYVDDVDSAYLDEKSHYWYGASLYGSDGKELSDLNALETALKEKFDDQTLELIK